MESVQNEHLEVIMGLIIHGGKCKKHKEDECKVQKIKKTSGQTEKERPESNCLCR